MLTIHSRSEGTIGDMCDLVKELAVDAIRTKAEKITLEQAKKICVGSSIKAARISEILESIYEPFNNHASSGTNPPLAGGAFFFLDCAFSARIRSKGSIILPFDFREQPSSLES